MTSKELKQLREHVEAHYNGPNGTAVSLAVIEILDHLISKEETNDKGGV